MKILHLIYDHINNPWVGGGAAVRVYEIYRRLSEKGYTITVISGNYPGAKDYKINDNFEYKFVGSQKSYIISTFSYAINVWELLKDIHKQYDVIIEDFAPWNPCFSLLITKKSILQLHHKEGVNILKRYNIFGLPFFVLENIYPRFFKRVMFVSQESKNKFKVDGAIIPNGISRIEEHISSGSYISYIGRIDIYNKGLDILVNAIKDIDLKIPIRIAGKGKDIKRLKEYIKLFNLERKVFFDGFLDEEEKYNFIKNSKFLLIPSRFEGQAIVALEAAAMGKPVIVSDIPELKYVVENGFGISFKREDPIDLKKKILFLLEHPELIEEMGRKGIEFAKNFTWDRISKIYETLLMGEIQ
ncbi:MAG: glycosyltransferase family 4 protein [Hydrogenothermaceae bacterium]